MGIIGPASSAAERVDAVFLYILALSAAFLVAITVLMVVFVIRYSRKRNPKPKDIEGSFPLEVAWTVIPLGLFLSMFYFGWTDYAYMRNAPRDAMTVKVTGRQWKWGFEYPNGKQTEELYLALDKPVKLEIRSNDVIHGFYVPAFRIKMDAVPGKVNTTWFEPTLIGAFDIECTVICGVDHSYMLSRAVVVPVEEFREWYDGPQDAPPPGKYLQAAGTPPDPNEAPGYAVLRKKACLACHSVDDRTMVGPTFKGAFGSKVHVRSADGTDREVEVDEEYIRRSIRQPMAEIAKGYPPTMPLTPLTDDELAAVVGYMKTLK
jgi:cytochrome c oxidase subunit 2